MTVRVTVRLSPRNSSRAKFMRPPRARRWARRRRRARSADRGRSLRRARGWARTWLPLPRGAGAPPAHRTAAAGQGAHVVELHLDPLLEQEPTRLVGGVLVAELLDRVVGGHHVGHLRSMPDPVGGV